MMTSFNRPNKIKNFKFWISILVGLVPGIFALLGCTPISSTVQNPTRILPSATPIISDNLGALIGELEGAMPQADSEGFIIPSKSDQQSFHDMVNEIEDNNPDLVAQSALAYNYELLRLPDQKDSGAESYVLHERLPIQKGWGSYFFRIQSSQNIVIEAPHPLADEYTPAVALDLYRALQAKALLISGTHRNANADGSADSAHAKESIFQTVHIALFQLHGQPNNKTIFLQIHGYATDEHRSYPQVVIGYNWKNDPEKDLLLTKIANALRGNSITVGICNGKNYKDLCGTSNIQRSVTDGGIFIHMELSESLRINDSAFVTSLQQAMVP
jgi:hypothetical protein